jgi:translation initiation factor 2B subunit (eIF-2B alpha/beta/delta family)
MRRYVYSFVIMILAGALFGGCENKDKIAAEGAFKAAEEALNVAKAEASKYVPDQVRSLESALSSTREKLSKGDYKAVLSEAPALTSKAQEIASAAAAKKAELTKSWEGLSSGMPRVVEAIQSRVDILSQSKKLPAGMSAETLAQAKAGLSEITQQWTAATEASKGGNLMDAVAKASSVKVKAAEVLTLLKMPVPEALKS